MKYNIGDKVQINLEKVDDKHKKYKGIYEIVDIRKTFENIYIYKLKNVPNWGTEEMLIPIEMEKSND